MLSPPLLDSPYSLTDQAVTDYQQNGHILMPQLASSDEVSFYRKAIGDAVDRYNTETRPMAERDTYGKAFLQIFNLWEHDEAVRRFTLSQRFAGVAARLMGCERVRIYHDQALYKEPGGGRTPWHQDQYYWPLDTTQTITMWMPLVDLTSDMGIMTFASAPTAPAYSNPITKTAKPTWPAGCRACNPANRPLRGPDPTGRNGLRSCLRQGHVAELG